MAHARLGPSNARWPHCPGSVREEANYPDIAGAAAIDGTGSHLLLEMCLKNNVEAIQYDQQIIGANHPENPAGWLVDPERAKRVQMCLNYVERRVNELKADYPQASITVEAESKSDPGSHFGRDDWWGTCDITIMCRHKHTGDVLFLEVVDYKDGRGFVKVNDNTQLISYLFGKIATPGVNRVAGCRMTIVQPKTVPVIRYQCSTREDDNFSPTSVAAAADKLAVAAAATDKPDAPCISGNHCQWCKADPKRGGHCMTATDKSLEVVKKMSNLDTTTAGLPAFEYIGQAVADPKSLTPEQLSELISAKEALMAVFDKAEIEATERLESGQAIPGYEMRPGRGSREWAEDDETIAKKLKAKRLKLDEIYPKKLASPAQILKNENLSDIQKRKIESELVESKPGKLKLTKVAHQSVAQSSTTDVQSTETMFSKAAEQTKPASPELSAPATTEVSFF